MRTKQESIEVIMNTLKEMAYFTDMPQELVNIIIEEKGDNTPVGSEEETRDEFYTLKQRAITRKHHKGVMRDKKKGKRGHNTYDKGCYIRMRGTHSMEGTAKFRALRDSKEKEISSFYNEQIKDNYETSIHETSIHEDGMIREDFRVPAEQQEIAKKVNCVKHVMELCGFVHGETYFSEMDEIMEGASYLLDEEGMEIADVVLHLMDDNVDDLDEGSFFPPTHHVVNTFSLLKKGKRFIMLENVPDGTNITNPYDGSVHMATSYYDFDWEEKPTRVLVAKDGSAYAHPVYSYVLI